MLMSSFKLIYFQTHIITRNVSLSHFQTSFLVDIYSYALNDPADHN